MGSHGTTVQTHRVFLRPAAIFFLATGLFTTAGCAEMQKPGVKAKPIGRIAFTVDDTGLPTFEAVVNGQKVRLFLDTGGYKTLALKQEAIARLGLPYEGASQKANDAQRQTYISRSFTASSLKAGSLDLTAIHGADLPPMEGSHSYPQDGYIGYGLLKDYLLVFDYPMGELRLFSKDDLHAMQTECGDGATFT